MAQHVELRKPGNGQEPYFTSDYPGIVSGGGTPTTPASGVMAVHVIDPSTGLPPTGAVSVTGASTDPNRARGFNASGTITRPANQTPYSIGDAVSDNGTAGSVTAASITVSDTNDHPVAIDRIRLATTDTGPATASAVFEIWIYNSNPTSNSGVAGGDNAAFSNKQAGFVGRYTGTFFAMADGSVANLTPVVGSRIITVPTSGGVLLYWQMKTLTAWTPSANSTQFVANVEGFQLRA